METHGTIEKDIIEGAAGIAKFIFGDEKRRREVYRVIDNGDLPVFRLGAKIFARKSTILEWIAAQEKHNATAA